MDGKKEVGTLPSDGAADTPRSLVDFLLGSMSDCALVLDREYRIVYANPSGVRFFGSLPADVRGAKFPALLAPAQDQDPGFSLEALVSSAGAGRKVHVLDAEGKVLPMHGVAIPYALPDQKDCTLVVLRRLAQPEKIDEDVRKTSDQLSLFLRHSPAAYYVKDADGRILHLSPHFEQILARPLGPLIGKTNAQLWPEALATKMTEDEEVVLRTGRPLQVRESYRGHTYMSWKFRILQGDRNPPLLGGYMIDITELEDTRVALEALSKRFETVINTVPIGINECTMDGTIVLSNPTEARQLGYAEGELVGMNIADLQAEGTDQVAPLLQSLAQSRKPLHAYHKEVKRKDGVVRSMRITPAYLLDAHGRVNGFISAVEDITERLEQEKRLKASSEELVSINAKLEAAYDETLEGWVRALELREHETAGHSHRVVEGTVKLARLFGIHGEELATMRRGALLHDVGKIGVPDEILLKPGKFTPDERSIMEQHPEYAVRMLGQIAFLAPALDIPLFHHEYWDGKGYPRKLAAEDIPFAARIFTIIDTWDALTTPRIYRAMPFTRRYTYEYIMERKGTQFDPRVVDAFRELVQAEKMLEEQTRR